MENVNIVEAIEAESLFRPLFKDLESWWAWKVFLKSLYGLKMTPGERELYTNCTGRKKVSKKGFKEAYAICGRRGGKSFISALIAVFTALFSGLEKQLSPGETGYVFCIATDKRQARIVLDYIKAFLELFPDMLDGEPLTWEIRLKNNINIEVRPANFRAGRGATTILIILDELAFFRDENSANPAQELVNSLLPGLHKKGLLLGISTPYGKFGYLYQIYKDYFGNDDSDILVWKGETQLMNPTYDVNVIKRLIARDKSAMTSEYMAEFREDIEQFLGEDLIDLAMDSYIFHHPASGFGYKGFIDPSGGRQDSFTLGIAHSEDGIVCVDRIEEYKPPFEPETVVGDFCEILRNYGIWKVTGDRYAAEWVSSAFKKNGIKYNASELDKSEIYLNAQPLFTMNKIRLPKNERLKNQLLTLERRTRSGGKDGVDHGKGLHDDLANSACGAAVCVQKSIFQKASPEELMARRPVTLTSLRRKSKMTPAQELEKQEIRDIINESRKELEEEKKQRLKEMRVIL